ncbi:hypothetical protein P3X46_009077 [Hevea brasiliensis]|uniref:Uncharacterized protein n=1 Tax=Hevea brasiliensis TaxID=3981 RepID=A0ABQ9MLU1_HEVBR|nr:hypothetical protein P3X46_009077 [Hevea brasiliensis]
MAYLLYFPLFNPYPMYPPQQHPQSSSATIRTQNPMEGVTREQVPPPPPAAPIVLTQETKTSSRGRAKMPDYLKLDAPKYKKGEDPFEYVKAVKMIADESDTNASRATQMVSFTLKCKMAKEWYKSYVVNRVDSVSSIVTTPNSTT